MGRNSFNGGSSVEGPGGAMYRRDPDDRVKKKDPDPELERIMLEHDRLRSMGRDPMAELKADKKKAKKHLRRKRAR